MMIVLKAAFFALAGIFFGLLQFALLKKALCAHAGWRIAMIALKLPLWAMAFIAVALLFKTPLAFISFAAGAAAIYTGLSIYKAFSVIRMDKKDA